MDLISYYPDFSELTEAQVQATRDRIVTYWRGSGFPNLDMRPGSLLGDRVVTPMAYKMAAMETAADRFCSDLDLEQVAKGVIYNCDFVRKFLANFAIYPKEGLFATGIVRLVFSTDESRELNRGIKLQLGNNAGNVFYFRLPFPGDVQIRPVGSYREAGANVYPMFQLSDSRFAADIPVKGQMAADVLAGDTGATNEVVENLTALTALVNFDPGTAPESLPKLAARTRTTFYGANMSQRGSAARFLLEEYPDLVVASPVLTGDKEMLRDSVNPLGFGNPAMDVYIRSTHYQQAEQHTIRLNYVAEQNSLEVDRFIGRLDLAGIPVQVQSIVYAGNTSINLDDGQGSVTVYSRSRDAAKAPLLSAGFSALEELWLVVEMPRDSAGAQLIVPEIDADGVQYASFTISYKTEPMVLPVSDYMLNNDVAPPGISPLVRAVLPHTLEALTIRYTREPGTEVLLETAREEIYQYLLRLGYPSVYTDAKISDSMFYAGASSVVAIECTGRLRWSVADKVLPADAPALSEDYTGADDAALVPPRMDVRSSSAFGLRYRDLALGTADATYVAAGPRNTGVLLDRANIVFKEELP